MVTLSRLAYSYTNENNNEKIACYTCINDIPI